MKKTLPIFGIDLVYDETLEAVLVQSGGRTIDFHHASSRRHAKKVMSQVENDFHRIARGGE